MSPMALSAERSTLAVLAFGVASLALSPFVRPAAWLLTAAAMAVRALIGPRLAVGEWTASGIGWLGLMAGLAEIATGGAWVVALVDFLLVLAAAVAIEEACARNQLHRLIVGTFLVLAACVLTDTFLLAIPLAGWLVSLQFAAWRLHQIDWCSQPPSIGRQVARGALALFAGASVLFVFAPRFGVHLGLQPVQPKRATSGFSDQVRLGDFARSLDNAVVMRIEAAPGTPPERVRALLVGRYWRGAVLSRFTGAGWRRLPARVIVRVPQKGGLRLASGSAEAEAFVYRESVDHAFLLWPEGALFLRDLPQALVESDRAELRFLRAPPRRVRVRIALAGQAPAPMGMRPPLAEEQSTARISPRLRAWVQRWQAMPPKAALSAIEGEMRSWRYALNAPVDARDPLGWFIEHKTGHCELYASAFALAARLLGLPSRVVNGYRGGEWNELGRHWIVRERHAHSWVEVWLDGRWQRFDPTPPAREALVRSATPMWQQAWDALLLAWYRYVLEFESQDRASLLQWLRAHALWLATVAGVMAGLWFAVRLFHAKSELVLLDAWLAMFGVRRSAHEPVRFVAPKHIDATSWRRFVADWERARMQGSGRFGLVRLALRLLAMTLRAFVQLTKERVADMVRAPSPGHGNKD